MGSFTGVRICTATAKGIALGLDLPLFGISTLDAQAWDQWVKGACGEVVVLGDAMRKEVYPVRYVLNDGAAFSMLADAEWGRVFLIVVTGLALAALAAALRWVEVLLRPLMLTIKSIPVASFIILALMWLRSAGNLAVFISFLMVLPVVYTNTLAGIRETDARLLEMAAVFRVPPAKRVRYLYVPAALPYFRSACTVGLGLCWKSGVAAEVIGIDRATFTVEGKDAFGMLRAEAGVHRLVRISPFDASGRRHTSFASVEVLPELPDDNTVEIDPEDIKMEVFRSSGAGGQHINKTSSAVRLIHIPTGIVVSCQNERSQFQNRDMCMKMLTAKLVEIKEREHLANINEIKGEQMQIAWGSQIRSYVFMPYTLVKDTRTGFESTNVNAVMDGDLDGFINAYLTCAATGTWATK